MKHSFGEFNGEQFFTSKNIARPGDQAFIISGDNRFAPHRYTLEGIFKVTEVHAGDLPLKTTDGKQVIKKYRWEVRGTNKLSQAVTLNDKYGFDQDDFRETFSKGLGANLVSDSYVAWLTEIAEPYIKSENEEHLVEDLSEVLSSATNETERRILASARVGQGIFRQNVIKTWQQGEKCALTGLDIPAVLIASHIRPWRNCRGKEDRLDGCNGLLLSATIDKLFDKHLISFEEKRGDLQLVASPRIKPAQLKALGLFPGMKLSTSYTSIEAGNKIRSYMEEHLAAFREKL